MTLDVTNPSIVFLACVILLLWTCLVAYVARDEDPWPSAFALFGVVGMMLVVTPFVALIQLVINSL